MLFSGTIVLSTAVDDPRHTEVVYLAQAVSIQDLREQVKACSPEGTAIPSQLNGLQFCPKTKRSKVATRYSGTYGPITLLKAFVRTYSQYFDDV